MRCLLALLWCLALGSPNDKNDPSMMQRLFKEISDPVRVIALNKAIEALEKHGFSRNDRYIATTEPGHKVDVQVAGIAVQQFMGRTKTAILIGQTRDLPQPRPELRHFTLVPTSWGYGPKEPQTTLADPRVAQETQQQLGPDLDEELER